MQAPLRTAPAAVPFGQACVVLDVRTDLEHREVSLKQAHQHVPLDALDPARFLQDNKIDATRPIYILCRSGKRATRAAEGFAAVGHDNVHVIEGGIIACEAAGIPVRKGQVISLERQTRIVIGSLVILGTALGALLSPWFYAFAALVGAGLVFAGVTDTCAVALLLAKAPWNRGLQQSCATGAVCGAPASCQTAAAGRPAIKMPEGVAFYSSSSGAAPQAGSSAPARTKSGGGCS